MSNPVEGIKTVLFKSSLLALANKKDEEVNKISQDFLAYLDAKYGNEETYLILAALGLTLHKFAGILEKDA